MKNMKNNFGIKRIMQKNIKKLHKIKIDLWNLVNKWNKDHKNVVIK